MAGESDYWVEISWQGRRLGGGFAVDRHHILTASHCLRRLDSDDADLELSFASGEVSPGRVCERDPGADLALITIRNALNGKYALPVADRATRGDRWFAPYRPTTGDPHLSGEVDSGPMAYRCETGHEIEVLQLGCAQRLGSYYGYSGGPIERDKSGDRVLLGVLLEQAPDRVDAGRAADVLFAATIAEAIRRFRCLSAERLFKFVSAGMPAPFGCSSDAPFTRDDLPSSSDLRADVLRWELSRIRQLVTEGVLDEAEMRQVKIERIHRFLDGGNGPVP